MGRLTAAAGSMSLFQRIALLLVAVTAPFALFSAAVAWQAWQGDQEQARTQASSVAKIIAAEIGREVSYTRHLLATFSALTDPRKPLGRLCANELHSLVELTHRYHQAVVANSEGLIVCAVKPFQQKASIADRGYFQQVIATRDFAASGFITSRTTGRPTIAAAFPLFEESGYVRGMVVVALDLARLQVLLQDVILPAGAVASLLDVEARVIARHPALAGIWGQRVPEADRFLALAGGRTEGHIEAPGFDGRRRILAFARVKSDLPQTLYVRIGIPVDETTRTALKIARSGFGALLLLLAVTILAAWYASQRLILRPLGRIAAAAERLGAGDLAVRTGLSDRTELGRLGSAFDQMASRLEQSIAAAQRTAREDPSTGLPNRAALVERLGRMLNDSRPRLAPVALLVAYMPRMQDVYDALGYDPANQILKSLAARLRANAEFGGHVARVSFDEFAVALQGADLDEATVSVHRLQRIFQTPVTLEQAEIEIQATVGIAVYPDHGDEADLLIRRAGLAAREGARTHEPRSVYGGGSARENPRHLALIAELRSAIAAGQLEAHYQPKVDLASRRIVGFEALVRWRHPAKGLISPGEFIPVAERTGLMRPLTRAVIEMVMAQLAAWSAAGRCLPVAVNLSAASLYDPQLVEGLLASAERHRVALGLLELEITESSLVERAEAAATTLKALRAQGCRIYIDDFGTGYSSLSYLSRLPVDALKIDRSFIVSMHEAPDDMSLVSTIISLCRALNMGVVAEGVETEAQARLLALLKCDQMQGYLVSKPVPAEAALDLLRSQGPQ